MVSQAGGNFPGYMRVMAEKYTRVVGVLFDVYYEGITTFLSSRPHEKNGVACLVAVDHSVKLEDCES
jgi:hypothetical protein